MHEFTRLLCPRPQEAEAKARADEEERRRKFEEEQARFQKAQAELQSKLDEQVAETRKAMSRRERERKQRSALEQGLIKAIPMINEANLISDELKKGVVFKIKLMETTDFSRKDAATETAIRILVTKPGSAVWEPIQWDFEKFETRLYNMREMYQVFVENERDLLYIENAYKPEDDAFFEQVNEHLIGRALIYLDPVVHLISIDEATPIINYKGNERGQLLVKIQPYLGPTLTKEDEDVAKWDAIEHIDKLKGKELGLKITVDAARGLPKSLCADTHVRYSFWLETEWRKTVSGPARSLLKIGSNARGCMCEGVFSPKMFVLYLSSEMEGVRVCGGG